MTTKIIKSKNNEIKSNTSNLNFESFDNISLKFSPFAKPSHISDENKRTDLCEEATVRKIDDLITFVEKNELNILLPDDGFFTAFHSLLQTSSYRDFR
jgi:hypothetical protein